jgi:hypothetical protein
VSLGWDCANAFRYTTPIPGGCMAQKQVDAIEKMDFIHWIFTPINRTVPAVEVRQTISTANITYVCEM